MDINKFYIRKDSQRIEANILTNFTIFNDTYCIYTIPTIDKNHNVHCAKLIGNNLIPITDEKELSLTNKIVTKYIESLKKITN